MEQFAVKNRHLFEYFFVGKDHHVVDWLFLLRFSLSSVMAFFTFQPQIRTPSMFLQLLPSFRAVSGIPKISQEVGRM